MLYEKELYEKELYEKEFCWSEQSPEKSTISTVPFFVGHPVFPRCVQKQKRMYIQYHFLYESIPLI